MQYILNKNNIVFAEHEEDQRVLARYGDGYTHIFAIEDFEIGDEVKTFTPSPAKLSKRALISYLSAKGFWGDVRNMIEGANMMDLWNATTLIDFADPDFQAFLSDFSEAAGQMGIDMADLIENCRFYRD